MRYAAIIAVPALIIAIGAIWGATVIPAKVPKKADVAPASVSIDVMQLMKDAKNLPEEQFDTH